MSLISPAVYKEHDPGCSLGDDALQRLIDANEAFMVRVLGPHSREGSPVVEQHAGWVHALAPVQPVGEVVTLEERPSTAESWTVLASDDYETLNGGLTLVRLSGGTNSRSTWDRLVRLTYVPRHNLEERIAALLEMVGMDASAGVTSGGLVSRTMGSWSETYGSGEGSRKAAKARVLASLHPTGGLVIG